MYVKEPKTQMELYSEWLDDFVNYEKTEPKAFTLETMKYVDALLDNPDKNYSIIHAAGSKGKGSVCKMIGCILDQAGKKTGIYSSPHLTNIEERISTPYGFFDEEIYRISTDKIYKKIQGLLPFQIPGNAEPTYFEMMTLLAFEVFKNAGIETAVLETGMGGRLDATNIVNPLISVITPIELEHTRILGNTIEQIATEKAGIIKRNRPVAVSFQSPKAEKIIREKAAEEDSTAYFIKDIVDEIIWNPSPSGMDLEIRWKDKKVFKRNIKTRLKLLGQVQGENAALAALSCKIAYPEITEETIEKGLSKAWIPSRFEIVNTNPPVILDGAHTPLSISFSLETLNSLWPDKKVNLLFACAQDKKVEEISRILCPRCSKIFITKPGNTKPCNPERMVKAFKESLLEKFSEDHQKVNETLDMDLDFVNSINRALKTSEKENRILLVTGSFYLTAEVKKIISGEKN